MLARSLQRLVPVVERLARETPKTIDTLVQWGQDFDLETLGGRRAAGDAIATLVEHIGGVGAKMSGEFTTPQPVVELMVDLVRPSPGERVYDPCFGCGGVLATVASRLQERAMQMPPMVWSEVQRQGVFGVEIVPSAYSIGLARVVLAGIDQVGLELGDALDRRFNLDRSSDGFDCILAVPPWGGRVESPVAAHSRVSKANRETLFLEHVMGSLRQGGRAVVVLPEGVLFRTGRDQMVRQQLLTDFCVEGVISLPAGAFHPYTGIKASLVLFRRKKPAQAVRFLQVDEWPSYRPGDTVGREKAIAVARGVAEEFGDGTQSSSLWETPVNKLATRDWELLAKRTGEEALSRSLGALGEADPEVLVEPLGEIAEVFSGLRYLKDRATPPSDDPSTSTGMLRVADLDYPGVRSPSIFLTKKGGERVQPKHRLRAGDILISTFGTIGKLGIVYERSGAVDAVAANGLAVIRPGEGISPQFLQCLLASRAYQKWFRGHARGATIQSLSVRHLRRLPVPAPEVPIQERVIRLIEAKLGHPFAGIISILAGGGDDPIVSWLEGSTAVRELEEAHRVTDSVGLLERVARSIRDLQAALVDSDLHTMPLLSRWLKDLARAMRALLGLNHVPSGPGRWAILESVGSRLVEVDSALGESSLPVLDSARDVTGKIAGLVRAELGLILDAVGFESTVEPSAVVEGIASEIQVRLKNLSPLALRNVSFDTSPGVGSASIAYLTEGRSLSFAAQIPACAGAGAFRFQLQWRADRLDGRRVSGEVPLAVDVRLTPQAVRIAELGTSPYVVGSPIDRPDMFFGRQDIIEKIQRQLSTRDRANVVLLEGNRRTGKTSILKRLQAPDVLPGWIAVYCSLQGGEGHESKPGLRTNEVFRLMARDIGLAAHDAGLRVWFADVEPPDPKLPFRVALVKALSAAFSGPRPFEVFELYLQGVLEASSPRRLLLMLDEFDKLQEGIGSGITSPQVPENIRYLLHAYPNLSAIISGSRRLKRLRERYWSALFGLGHRVPVSELPLEGARRLVTQPVEGRLTYVAEARDRVVELCSRQAFLIQSLCNRIFERAAHVDRRIVTVGAVNRATEEMVKDNEHFRTLWDYAGTDYRRFVLALCERLEAGPDAITLSLLETKLEEHGVALPRKARLGADLDFLRELELLDLEGSTRGSAYVLSVPLMAGWMRRNVDFEQQRRRAIQAIAAGTDGTGYGPGDYGDEHGGAWGTREQEHDR